MARRFTDTEREHALKLYELHGPAEAGRRTGISSATVRQWAVRAGVTVTRRDTARANVQAARLTWAQRRGELTVRSGEIAGRLLERIEDAKPRDARLLAATYAVVVDRAQLLDGAATERTETPDLTSAVDAAIDKVLGERKPRD